MTPAPRARLQALVDRWRSKACDLAEKAASLSTMREPERVIKLRVRAEQLESDASDLAACLAAEGDVPRTAPEPQGKWQPIETAPKDGRVVLVWWPIGDFPSGNHEFASFVDFKGQIPEGTFDGQPYRSDWCNDHDGAYLPVEPTHWMPLPEPPR